MQQKFTASTFKLLCYRFFVPLRKMLSVCQNSGVLKLCISLCIKSFAFGKLKILHFIVFSIIFNKAAFRKRRKQKEINKLLYTARALSGPLGARTHLQQQ